MSAQQRYEISRRTLLAAAGASLAALGLTPVLANSYAGKRVLHIDSYHAGNEWNDGIAAAVRETLEAAGVEVKIIHLDTKRKPTEADILAAAEMARATIAEFRPDVVTVSDDNAVEHVLMPHFRDAELPFVFCGLNWDASVYGLPYRNATGMVEVSPIPQILRLLESYAHGGRLGLLTEDTPTKHKEMEFHGKLFGIEYTQAYFVSSFADWRSAFLRAQHEVDSLVLLGVGALTDWDAAAGRDLAEAETRIPSGTDFEWLMPYSLIGVVKEPAEQGEWAARAALKILDGVAPHQIPIAYNKRGALIFNRRIAATLGIRRPPPLARLVD